MSAFLTRLHMELMVDENGRPLKNREGRQLYQLLSDFVYDSDVARPFVGGPVIAPAGFVTDLCSKPQVVLSLMGDGEAEEGVPHDLAYSKGNMPREVADSMLYEACILNGVPKWKAKMIYWGVRIGGASRYTKTPAGTPDVQ